MNNEPFEAQRERTAVTMADAPPAYAALDGAARAAYARRTYALLGLAPECGAAKLKKAYKQNSLLYHPDKQHGKSSAEKEQSAAMFLKVKEAYELLSDEKTRLALDDAVAGTMRARRAHEDRTARMDATTKRFRDDLERRERAATTQAPTGSEAEARQRNQQRQADYGLADARKERARADKRKAESLEDRAARVDKLSRSVEVKFSKDPGDAFLLASGCTHVERPSAKKALLIFESAESAVACAIDEAFGSSFKDVKLKTSDAWERIRAAVARRAAKDRDEAPELGAGRDGADRTAERERLLREAAHVTRARGDPAAKRRRLVEAAGRFAGAGPFAEKEAQVLRRLVAKCDV